MTSRERILAALEHREPDRLPVDIGAMRSTGIAAIAYSRLKAHLGIAEGATRVYDMIQQLALPEDAILRRFGADVIDLGRATVESPDQWTNWTLPDGSPCEIPVWLAPERDGGRWLYRHSDGTVIAEMRPGMRYFEQSCFPLANREVSTLSELRDAMKYVLWSALPCPPWHQLATDADYERLKSTARRLYETTDKAIMVAYGGNLLEWAQFLLGIENLLTALALDRPRVERLLDLLVESHLEGLGRYLDAVGDTVQIIQFGDDLGTQQGPQISPRMYREIFKPRHAAIYRTVKERCAAKVFLHTCGGIYELIPDLIDAGVDILNPVQTSAVNMEPERLKREFGRDLVFWGGGCDTQIVLPTKSPSEVAEHVRRQVDAFATGGGFVFTAIHNVLADVPPENVVAMYDAALGRA